MPIGRRRDTHRGWIILDATGPIKIGELVDAIRTVRASVEQRMVPMLLDASDAHGGISDSDVEQAVMAVQDAVRVGGLRAHVAIVASDDALYAGMLRYEARCADIGVRVIRVFRQLPDAQKWLEIVSAARDLR